MKVDPEILRQLLSYNPDSGKLFWLDRHFSFFSTSRSCSVWNAKYAGREAFTCISTTGYFYGNVFGRKHFTHRVAFAMVEGFYPEFVDHINGDRLDNRWCNLREATSSGNAQNVCSSRTSSSKYLGVSWANRGRGSWYACITIEGKTKSLGRYSIEEDAARAYDVAAIKNYGEFARLNFPMAE